MKTRLLFTVLAFSFSLFLPEASAAIVYTEGYGNQRKPGRPERPYSYVQDIDMNGDGAYDYYFGGGGASLWIVPTGANRILSIKAPLPDLERDVVALRAGELIGAIPAVGEWTGLADSWNSADYGASILYSIYEQGTISNIPMSEETWLGLEYHLEDGVHYGWVSLRSGLSSTNAVYIYGWAYESEPGKPIIAGMIPEPSSALLLAGAASTLALRRKRRVV